jgi:hypothetical protein
MVLCINIKKECLRQIDPNYGVVYGKSSPHKFTTAFYKLSSNETKSLESTKSTLTYIDDNPEFDITQEKCIAKYFKDIVLATFNAKRYMLFIWDHGAPFGVFSNNNADGDTELFDISAVESAKKNTNKLTVIGNFKFTLERFLFFRQNTFIKEWSGSNCLLRNRHVALSAKESAPSTNLGILTMSELKKAIGWAFGSKKIDVLVMMNCFTSYFDTGFELVGRVKYIVAPETRIYFNGYNYYSIFKKLSWNPALSAKKISKFVVASYSSRPYSDPEREKEAKDSVAIFANDVDCYTRMGHVINKLSTNLIVLVKQDFSKISKARDEIETIPDCNDYYLIDFNTLLFLLRKNLQNNWNDKLYKKYKLLLTNLRIARYIGRQYIVERSDNIVSPSAFSIFFSEKQRPILPGFSRKLFERRLTSGNRIL